MSDVSLVIVLDTMLYAARFASRIYANNPLQELIKDGQGLLDEDMDTAKAADVAKVSGSVERGHPADITPAEASELRAGLIVVGRRSIRALERFLMGSISSSVVGHSWCEVLLVKRG